MSYNKQAESFAARAAKPVLSPKPGITYPKGWSRFHEVYSDIADATPTDQPFRTSELIGDLPSIAAFAERTRREILAVVVRDMQAMPKGSHGIVKVRGGVYQWREVP